MKKFKISGRVIVLFLVLCITLLASYIYFISPTHIKITSYTYSSSLVDDQLKGFKIAYLSDVNLNDEDDIEHLSNAISKLNQHDYDLFIFGGDLYESKEIFSRDAVVKALSKINCDYGKFCVYGDKDLSNKKEVKSIFTEAGIELLNNTSRSIYYNNAYFELVACSNDEKISTIEFNKNKLVIDVTHQPDSFKSNANNVSLQLSGHSLGGSVYIPLIGGILKDEGFKTYNHGKYTKKDATLIVSNGVKGTTDHPFKIFCSNEILLIKLSTKKSK